MIRIDCFTRDGCDACKIAIKNITDAINEANCDITLNIRNTNLDDILRKEITKFPTTVITKVDNDYKRKELARLEGSFPSDYIKDIINKLETLKTCDEKSEVKVEHWNSTVSPIEEVIDYSKELSEVIITIE